MLKWNNLLQLNKNKIHNEMKREQNKETWKIKNQLQDPMVAFRGYLGNE